MFDIRVLVGDTVSITLSDPAHTVKVMFTGRLGVSRDGTTYYVSANGGTHVAEISFDARAVKSVDNDDSHLYARIFLHPAIETE